MRSEALSKKMKTGYVKKAALAIILLTIATPAFAIGSLIVSAYYGGIAIGSAAWTMGMTMAAMAINLAVSAIVARTAASSFDPSAAGASLNTGSRVQLAPATKNKLPVVYGQAYLGGTVFDCLISADNQWMFFAIAICEVTNTSGTPDTLTFGDIYWAGKKCVFGSNGNVTGLLDTSTGLTDTAVDGKLYIYTYKNGSAQPVNTTYTAQQIMQGNVPSGSVSLTSGWNSSYLMTNTCFAIVQMQYTPDAQLTNLQPTKFEVTNSRYNCGDCFLDYLTDTTYGAALPLSQIDTASLTALNTYCAQTYTYNNNVGGTSTQTRFRFDGVIDTNQTIMNNLQDMAASCDCLIRYNEITGQWGVIVQTSSYTVAMALTDSNIVSALTVTPLDISSSYNLVETKFCDERALDEFAVYTLDLNEANPSLMYPNEPVNKLSLALPLVNNNVRAQLIANRVLESSRVDLQLSCKINFTGIQLEAGDIVTVTNANYGWTAMPFRVNKVSEEFMETGAVTTSLMLSQFNSAVFDDLPVNEFLPIPSTGLPNPLVFGTIPAPVVVSLSTTSSIPYISVIVTSPNAGVTEYMELYYSAYASPTLSQLIFAATSEIQPSGIPYAPSIQLPAINLDTVPIGSWYFFARAVNNLGKSKFSSASSLTTWRPATIQFSADSDLRYVAVAYATSATGTGFSLSPRSGMTYFGLRNQNNTSITSADDPSTFKWYAASPLFGTAYYLCYINYGNRKFAFATDTTQQVGNYLFPDSATHPAALWSSLVDGTNYIDLDAQSGRLISIGTTDGAGANDGMLSVTHTGDGRVAYNMPTVFTDVDSTGLKTFTGGSITVDRYGRIRGLTAPDPFYITISNFTATSGQTVFTVSPTRNTNYISGQCLVFQNGCLLDPTSDSYTDAGGTTSTVTFTTGRTTGDIITVISFRSTNTAGTTTYASFSRNTISVTNQSNIIPTFTLTDGFEFLFFNGVAVSIDDYNIGVVSTGETAILDLPAPVTGLVTVIQWTANNLGTQNGAPISTERATVIGTTTYSYVYTASAFSLYENGLILKNATDYTEISGGYTLTNTPTRSTDFLTQKTFSRTGAA